MRLQDGDESKRDARDGQEVEHGVEQFVPDATAATTRSVEKHGLSREVDEPDDHEDGMQVELLLWAASPSERE